MPQRPEPVRRGRRQPGIHPGRPRGDRRRRVVDRRARRGLVVALDLHQQHGFGTGLAHELEEGAVEQLDRGRLVRQQRRHGVGEHVETPERDAQAGARGGCARRAATRPP